MFRKLMCVAAVMFADVTSTGDPKSEKRRVTKERKSWPWQIVMVFPSLSVSKVLPLTKL